METDEDRNWKMDFYIATAGDPEVKALAWRIAVAARMPDDPVLSVADLAASRNYLRKCMQRVPSNELQTMTPEELAGLWARGALGAARYRVNGGAAARPRVKLKRRAPTGDGEP